MISSINKNMKNIIIITSVVIAGIATSFAEGGEDCKDCKKGKRPTAAAIIEKLDANGDGSLSYDEFQLPPNKADGGEEKKQEVFTKIDSDASGAITLEELKTARKNRKNKKDKANG